MAKNVEEELWFKEERLDYWEEHGVVPTIQEVLEDDEE